MNDQVLQSLTDTTIKALIKGAIKEASLWVSQGKIIKDFILAIEAIPGKKDAYKILSSSPNCPYKVVQLRNYVKSYDLHNKLGIIKNNLKMTHYVTVFNSSLSENQQCNLLQIASDQNLSMVQFKELVKKSSGYIRRVRKVNTTAFQKFHDAYIKALTRACDSEREVAVKSIKEVLSFAVRNGLL